MHFWMVYSNTFLFFPSITSTFLLKGRPFIKVAPSFTIYVSCYLLYLSTIFWVDF